MTVIDFSKTPTCYWSAKAKIDFLQRILLTHSILYYKIGEPVIADSDFDCMAKTLFELHTKYIGTKTLEGTRFFYALHDFSGCSMFIEYQNLNQDDYLSLLRVATHLIKKNGGGLDGAKKNNKILS